VGLKLNGTSADDVNLLGDKINTTKKNMEPLIDKEVGIEVNTEKAKYMLMSCH
jgi:hypothetical protein